ncbi:NRDE family protein [Sabulilitoribacter multivorans]|uniref:NRDE family protein n=1 Tax=Flaviramulus multivorans TaxID=1304750 RepID=A0ABS9IIJ2_9FLAO|nr:NRDE family protein [Flaviramulus multivorans]MCF7560577.1 NRDE family protein [Flaviramulus multivorans]
MCTVTFVPKGNNDFILTSNRDEAPNRISLPPEFYDVDGARLLFPKDELSGGTWIGISEKNRLVCVLNGGFERHERKPIYRKSRGVVAKDFLVADDISILVDTYDFEDIEPFTMVITDWNANLKLFELVWDGQCKHVNQLPLEPKLWSSTTLFSKAMKEERQIWFKDFKKEHQLSANTILRFHKTAGKGNDDYGVIMNRGFVKTTSITQVEKTKDAIEMCYENLRNNLVSTETFNLPQTINE